MPVIQERRWTVIAGAGAETEILVVVFANSPHSRILSVKLIVDGFPHYMRYGAGRAELSARISLHHPVEVAVAFDGDTPIVTHVAVDTSCAQVAFFPNDAFGISEQGIPTLFLSELVRWVRPALSPDELPPPSSLTKEEELRETFALRERSEKRRSEAQRFFGLLDRAFFFDGAIDVYLYKYLKGRLEVRSGYAGKDGRGGVPHPKRFRKRVRDAATSTSKVLRELFQGETDDIGWTMELFSTERLVVEPPFPECPTALVNHGVPNGTDFYMFAECAFACLDNNLDQAFWELQLEHFVCAAHIYAEHARRSDGQYGYHPGRVPYPLERIHVLRREYAGGDREFLEDRFCSLVGQTRKSQGAPPARPLRSIRNCAELKGLAERMNLEEVILNAVLAFAIKSPAR